MNPRKKIKSRKRRVPIKGGAQAEEPDVFNPLHQHPPPVQPPRLERGPSSIEPADIVPTIIRMSQTVETEETETDVDYSLPESQDENNIIESIRNPSGCCTLPLANRLTNINVQIGLIHQKYTELIQKLADDTFNIYADNGELIAHPDGQNYDEWLKISKQLLFGYQRLSVNDLKFALFALLPQFELEGGIYDFKKGSTVMITMIKNYAYKMITSLFTTANITYAVMHYNIPGELLPNDQYQYLRNLLSLMKCGSTLINTKLKNNWTRYFEGGAYDPEVTYHHSGGNMIVMIAGMLCYLYDKRQAQPYGLDILEKIRQMFETVLGGYKQIFYGWLNANMANNDFKSNLYSCTENLSDMDFILFAPRNYVSHIENRELAILSNLSGKIIRDIINDSCNEGAAADATEDIHRSYARVLLPFHKRFDLQTFPWPAFKYSNLTQAGTPALETVADCNNHGYRQTANKILEVPMYLNRLKQGYLDFPSLTQQIPSELRNIYASKYGECIDLSIGTLQSEFYRHKHHNWEHNNYYTIETLLWELKKILSKTADDKTPKRIIRANFLELINIPMVNILFKVIAHHIQEYNYITEEKEVKKEKLIVKLQNEMDIAGYSSTTAAATSAATAQASAAEATAQATAATSIYIKDAHENIVKRYIRVPDRRRYGRVAQGMNNATTARYKNMARSVSVLVPDNVTTTEYALRHAASAASTAASAASTDASDAGDATAAAATWSATNAAELAKVHSDFQSTDQTTDQTTDDTPSTWNPLSFFSR